MLKVLIGASVVVAVGAFAIYWMTSMPGNPVPTEPAGVLPDEAELADELRSIVEHLAVRIGPRSMQRPEQLERARRYLAARLTEQGYEIRELAYGISGAQAPAVNIEARRSEAKGQLLLVGAHYDSVGDHCPGANDNASGVAALIALAKRLRDISARTPIRFVAFTNEEPPFFQTPLQGSVRYVDA
ncbi:MAG: M28 family peptidase, partial [Bdellovibrionales bacterium]|nr:M28 family peptidase [Bdellovibrionales bacterium]